MAFIQMSVPLVFWGQRPPSHQITCISRTEDKKGMATGSSTGQICLWDILKERETERVKLRPRCMLFGGQSAIISLCFVKNYTGDRDRIVSLSEKGSVSLWDGKDGTCLNFANTKKGRHTGLKSLSRSKHADTLIALYGQYSQVYLLDSNSLDVLCTLKSAHHPNWLAQVCFIGSIDKKDALLAVSVDRVAKHWLLPSRSEMNEQGVVFEETSLSLDIHGQPLTVSSATHKNHCTVLIVTKEAWVLYDATGGKMKQLLINPREQEVEAWQAGEFIDYGKIAVWAKEDSRCFIYHLSARCTPGLESLETSLDITSTAGCELEHVLGCREPSSKMAVYLDRFWMVEGDRAGRLHLWDIRKIKDMAPTVHHAKNTRSPLLSCSESIPPDSSVCIADSWEPPAMPCGLTDMLYPPESRPPTITCALYLSSFGRLVCGQSDGGVAVLSATQAATVLMLQPRRFSRGWPQHCILKGHQGRVTSLLYPHAYSKAYDSDYLVSGGSDFTVKLWDLYSGVLVHNFAVHGGRVKDIISCPPEVNPRLQTCVCSIAEDYSVAILSTSERKCLLVAACHSAPVNTVRWRLEEDFLLVHCIDGKLYVWQIETGSLDRCVDGESARTILSTTPEVTPPPMQSTSVPLQVRTVSVSPEDSCIQVLLFDPQNLINQLARMEKVTTPKARQPTKQVDAFRSYLKARRIPMGTGVSPAGGRGPRRESMPAGMPSQQFPGASVSREQERMREALGQMVAKNTSENLQELGPATTVDTVRLLLSCLHAWNLDESLDRQCEETLGLVRPVRPVCFGLMSKGECMSLVFPGWGLRLRQHRLASNSLSASGKGEETKDEQRIDESDPSLKKSAAQETISYTIRIEGQHEQSGDSTQPEPVTTQPISINERRHSGRASTSPQAVSSPTGHSSFTFDQKYHIRWQLSRSLTTQHLLTMVSISNTLMNQSVGAHALARSSGNQRQPSTSFDDDSDSEEEGQQMRDNLIRANWSQVVALHCVMLPERMEGKFRAPHLPVLASRFLDPCHAIREAAQALLQAELRRIRLDGRRELVQVWATKLQPPSAKTKHLSSEDHLLFEGPVPTQQQQTTALIILGMIGAEFNSGSSKSDTHHKGGVSPHSEAMDPAIARQTAKTLQAVLLEKPSARAPLHSNLRCSAAELLGRGFPLWEKYIDISQVVMGLLDIVIHYIPSSQSKAKQSHDSSSDMRKTAHSSSRAMKFASDVAQKALSLMIVLRPVTMVAILAKEVSKFLGAQHVTHFPHSSLQQMQVGMTPPPSTPGIVTHSSQLLPQCKNEVLDLMRTVIDNHKCSQLVSLQLVEVVDVVLFCSDQEAYKRKSILEIFPAFARLPNISYSPKSRRLAVGGRSGQVVVYDLKQGRTQTVNAHSHPVTTLVFSDDGKMLAIYAYGDSMLSVWQISSSLFGMNQAPKFVHSWPAVSSSTPSSHSNYVRVEWYGSKTVVLHMPEGVECKYSLQ